MTSAARAIARRLCIAVVAALALVAWVEAARAEPWPHWKRLTRDAETRLMAEVQERIARLPTPIEIRWNPRRLADFDFGAEVLAATAVDMDGAPGDELVVLTTAELVVLRVRGGVEVLARLDLPASLGEADQHPRDPRGEIDANPAAEEPQLWLFSSRLEDGAIVPARLPLAISERQKGASSCPPRLATFDPRRRELRTAGAPAFYARRCVRSFFDEAGRQASGAAELSALGVLSLSLRLCDRWGECLDAPVQYRRAGVGTAFSATDIDRDGRLELVSSAPWPAGGRDRVSVVELGAGEARTETQLDFDRGAAAVVIGQLDDDEELEVVSIHRHFRTSPFEVWLWN